MAERSLTERVEILEQKVDALQTLPDRVTQVETQILQLRSEMHDGFSAILLRLDGHDRRFEQIDRRFEDIEGRVGQFEERLERRIQEGDEETRRYMRVLHEEVLARLSLIQERPRRRKR